MKNKPNNPNAFPGMESSAFGQDTGHYHGMSLRDYFAAKAMQGLFSSMGEITNSWSEMAKDIPLKEYISNYAYEVADEMLKQRDL